MPIYEYLCESCGTLSETMQKVTDPAPKKCPECGSKKIARLVSRTSFQLKGGGWYADLYASPRPGSEKGKGAETAETREAGAAKPGADSPSVKEPAGSTASKGTSPAPAATAAPGAAKRPSPPERAAPKTKGKD